MILSFGTPAGMGIQKFPRWYASTEGAGTPDPTCWRSLAGVQLRPPSKLTCRLLPRAPKRRKLLAGEGWLSVTLAVAASPAAQGVAGSMVKGTGLLIERSDQCQVLGAQPRPLCTSSIVGPHPASFVGVPILSVPIASR